MFLLASGWTSWSVYVVVGALLFTAALITTFFRFRGFPFYPGRLFRLFIVRPFWYLQLTLPLVTAGALTGLTAGLLYGALRGVAGDGPVLHAAFAHALSFGRVAASIVFVSFGLFLVAGYIGSRQLRVRYLSAFIPGLPPEFDGFRIAQLSDLHVGPHLSRRSMSRVASITMSLRADAIAVTGDLVDDRSEDVAVYKRWFGSLRAPSGVYAIPGNHDIYAGWPATEAALRTIDGHTVLVNDAKIIKRGDARIAIAGTGDPAATRRAPFAVDAGDAAPDIGHMMSRIPADCIVIALAHNPALWPALAQRDVALTLSGHTHWGQLAIPSRSWDAAGLFLQHSMGSYSAGDSLLYINPGTGYWGLPFRLGATAEITCVVLRCATDGAASIEISDAAPPSS